MDLFHVALNVKLREIRQGWSNGLKQQWYDMMRRQEWPGYLKRKVKTYWSHLLLTGSQILFFFCRYCFAKNLCFGSTMALWLAFAPSPFPSFRTRARFTGYTSQLLTPSPILFIFSVCFFKCFFDFKRKHMHEIKNNNGMNFSDLLLFFSRT